MLIDEANALDDDEFARVSARVAELGLAPTFDE